MKMREPKMIQQFKGIMQGENIKKYVKYYKDVKKIYKTESGALNEDIVMYEVYSADSGTLYPDGVDWGLTILYPLQVCEECNMTRGHFHDNLECNEFYYGLCGQGLLLLMDEDGETWAEKVFEGSLHNINGNYAHRLINIGSEPLRVIAAWSNKAGHDYERVEKKPFRYRVYIRKGELIVEDTHDDLKCDNEETSDE